MLRQASIFAGIFQREVLRALCGNSNQLHQSMRQLSACMDKIDELSEANRG